MPDLDEWNRESLPAIKSGRQSSSAASVAKDSSNMDAILDQMGTYGQAVPERPSRKPRNMSKIEVRHAPLFNTKQGLTEGETQDQIDMLSNQELSQEQPIQQSRATSIAEVVS